MSACTEGGDGTDNYDYTYTPDIPSVPSKSYVKADQCLNKDWYNRTMQEREEQKYTSSTAAGWTRTVDLVYKTGVVFNGVLTTEVSSVITYSNGDVDKAVSYRHLDGTSIVHVGDIDEQNSAQKATTFYEGYTDKRFALQYEDVIQSSASLSHNWNSTVTATTSTGTATYGYSYSRTVRFFGRYKVTVPAGTFTTCRFDVETTRLPTTANGTASKTYTTSYVGVGNGTLVRGDTYASGGTYFDGTFNTPTTSSLELVSDTINGTPIKIQ
jgi:hypothetical protein